MNKIDVIWSDTDYKGDYECMSLNVTVKKLYKNKIQNAFCRWNIRSDYDGLGSISM